MHKDPSANVAESEMIPEKILKKYNAQIVKLKKGDILFEQGSQASHFFLMRTGKVKMCSTNEDGREFVQGYFESGSSFGEPPFFTHLPYPSSAVAVADSTVWKCQADDFLRLLSDHADIHLKLTKVLSSRLIYKSMMLTEIAVEEAGHRLTTLIEYFRASDPSLTGRGSFRVPFTRQQLADMTGLRVETVIRSIKFMQKKRLLSLDEDGKILWNESTHNDEG